LTRADILGKEEFVLIEVSWMGKMQGYVDNAMGWWFRFYYFPPGSAHLRLTL